MTPLFRKLMWLLDRRHKRAELEEELRFHLDAEGAEREAAGTSAADASREARLDFGSLAIAREDTRAAWGWVRLDQLSQDVRYAFRTMRRSPAFTFLAVLSMALGIGVNTAIFGFVDAILLQRLPVRDPEQLVRMRWHTPKNEMHGTSRHDSVFSDPSAGFTAGVFSYSSFENFQRHGNLFASVFAYQGTGLLTVGVGGQAYSANGEYVSGDYFQALGATPAAGRGLEPGDDRFEAAAAVVISDGLCRRQFSSPVEAIGRTLTINTSPFTIAGVMPPGFFGTDPAKAVDVYVPLHANVLIENASSASSAAARAVFEEPSSWWLEIMARRRPDVSVARIQAELAPAFKTASDEQKATSRRWRQAPALEIIDGAGGIDGLRRAYGGPLVMLIALASLILALACTNIANLLLARSSARTREIAVRLSIGAGRARIVRQLLTESLVLSCLGGAVGIVIAFWAQSWVSVRLNNSLIPLGISPRLNWSVLGVAAGLSVVTGVLFGLAPALQAARGKTMANVKNHRGVSEASASSWRRGGRRMLLAAQIAMTLVMLVAAGLFIRTLRNYQAIDLGFSSDHVLTFLVRADQTGLDTQAITSLYGGLRERLSALPGVQSVAMSDIPLIGDGRSFTTVETADRSFNGESSEIIHVGGAFFATMQVSIVEGRALTTDDERRGAPPVVVVDQTYAQRYLAGVDPIGQWLRVPGDTRLEHVRFAVIGVARNARIGALTGSLDSTVYFPLGATDFGGLGRMVFELRTSGDPMALSNAVRAIVRDVNPGVPVIRAMTQDALIESTINREALMARLCTTFAALSLAIAVVGLYGIVLYDVSRRRAEIGVRMALGARQGQIVSMVLREVIVVVGIGLVIGALCASAATGISKALLFGVKPGDVPTTAAAMTLLLVTTLIAALTPAIGAARVSPTVALRNE